MRSETRTGHRYGRAWGLFAVIAGLLLGSSWAYVAWREHSLEPLSVPVDLSKEGAYSFDVRWTHRSRYHPELRLQLPSVGDTEDWFGDSPPEVRIEVFDGGRRVLVEQSKLTGSDGWGVTRDVATSEVELYKPVDFEGRTLGSYSVSLTVVKGSPAASGYRPRFELSTNKGYVLLGPVVGLLVLIALLVGAALSMAVWQIVTIRWERRSPRNEPRTSRPRSEGGEFQR